MNEEALDAAMDAYHPMTVCQPDRSRLAAAIRAYVEAAMEMVGHQHRIRHKRRDGTWGDWGRWADGNKIPLSEKYTGTEQEQRAIFAAKE